ncbi:MAG: hypothetical protein QNJ55_30880 [Xenococcus sp. MO_188.B8]|nr:hypothetical protein [Xenococcus sp. MO_188.B8]
MSKKRVQEKRFRDNLFPQEVAAMISAAKIELYNKYQTNKVWYF